MITKFLRTLLCLLALSSTASWTMDEAAGGAAPLPPAKVAVNRVWLMLWKEMPLADGESYDKDKGPEFYFFEVASGKYYAFYDKEEVYEIKLNLDGSKFLQSTRPEREQANHPRWSTATRINLFTAITRAKAATVRDAAQAQTAAFSGASDDATGWQEMLLDDGELYDDKNKDLDFYLFNTQTGKWYVWYSNGFYEIRLNDAQKFVQSPTPEPQLPYDNDDRDSTIQAYNLYWATQLATGQKRVVVATETAAAAARTLARLREEMATRMQSKTLIRKFARGAAMRRRAAREEAIKNRAVISIQALVRGTVARRRAARERAQLVPAIANSANQKAADRTVPASLENGVTGYAPPAVADPASTVTANAIKRPSGTDDFVFSGGRKPSFPNPSLPDFQARAKKTEQAAIAAAVERAAETKRTAADKQARRDKFVRGAKWVGSTTVGTVLILLGIMGLRARTHWTLVQPWKTRSADTDAALERLSPFDRLSVKVIRTLIEKGQGALVGLQDAGNWIGNTASTLTQGAKNRWAGFRTNKDAATAAVDEDEDANLKDLLAEYHLV